MRASSGTKVILYRDRMSSLILWARSVLLLPWWLWLVTPILGSITSRIGSIPYQSGYIAILLVGLYLYVQEVLQRKIKIDDERIYFGYRSYKLSELASVGLVYGAQKVVPKKLLLYFGKGVKLPLYLNRFESKDFEALLNLVENKVPHCSIDPVIGTLTKGKKLARKAAMDETDRTEIVYHSRRFLREMGDTFLHTADGWTRLGPVLTVIATSPFWLSAINGPYAALLPDHLTRSSFSTWAKVLTEQAGAIDSKIGSWIDAGGTACWHVITNGWVMAALIFSLVPVFYHIFKLSLKPNRLVIDAEGCRLALNLGSLSIPSAAVRWSEITSASLAKPTDTSGPESWTISLNRTNSSDDSIMSLKSNRKAMEPVNLELAAITPEDRVRLSKALHRWAPHCAMDTELAQTLLPKQTNSYTELWMQSLAAPSERANLEPLSSGRVLQEGRFEVIRRLGIGGQGAAYLCDDHDAQIQSAHTAASPGSSKVVLKETILPVFVETVIRQQALERFDQEAQILRALDNEHIVKLIDYFVEDHRGYLILEWVDGTSLRQVIENRGALPEFQVTELCKQMCEMLDYLHERSILHRDFTPDNLILQKDGKLKLIDFNVAQQADESSTGVVVGKQAYMPAEQFRGKPIAQSDIYAMGATLYFLLTGSDPEPLTQSCAQDLKPQVSDQMDALIKKCTEIDSKKRYSSVKDVAKALTVDAASDQQSTRSSKKPLPAIATAAKTEAAPDGTADGEMSSQDNVLQLNAKRQMSEVEIDG